MRFRPFRTLRAVRAARTLHSASRLSPLALAASLAVAGLSVTLTGCGPRWVILAQARPDPLVGAGSFYIEPIHYDPPRIGEKTEGEYLADKTPDQKDSWLTDKSDTSNRYIGTLIAELPEVKFLVQPAPGVFIIRPIVSFIEPGFYAYVAAAPTQVKMRIEILSSDGAVIDDIMVPSVIGASMVNASSGSRLRLAGQDLARVTAQYLRKRIVPGT